MQSKAQNLTKGESWRVFRPPPRIYGEMLKDLEYRVEQEPYDDSLLQEGSLEQGYRLPHFSDHEWPERDWNDAKILKLCGPVIRRDP